MAFAQAIIREWAHTMIGPLSVIPSVISLVFPVAGVVRTALWAFVVFCVLLAFFRVWKQKGEEVDRLKSEVDRLGAPDFVGEITLVVSYGSGHERHLAVQLQVSNMGASSFADRFRASIVRVDGLVLAGRGVLIDRPIVIKGLLVPSGMLTVNEGDSIDPRKGLARIERGSKSGGFFVAAFAEDQSMLETFAGGGRLEVRFQDMKNREYVAEYELTGLDGEKRVLFGVLSE